MKDRIHQIMKQMAMSQKQFANELCLAEATLSSIFTGRTKPSANVIRNIHERFPEVSVTWLMFGEGEMYVGEVVQEASRQSDVSSTPSAFASEVAPVSDQCLQNTEQPVPPIAPVIHEVVKYIDKPQRKITEIRVFFDDGTYETFSS